MFCLPHEILRSGGQLEVVSLNGDCSKSHLTHPEKLGGVLVSFKLYLGFPLSICEAGRALQDEGSTWIMPKQEPEKTLLETHPYWKLIVLFAQKSLKPRNREAMH